MTLPNQLGKVKLIHRKDKLQIGFKVGYHHKKLSKCVHAVTDQSDLQIRMA